jgi:transposase
VLCEGEGKPITVTVTPGQEHETTQAAPLLDQVCIRGRAGRPRRCFERVGGDKGYDSRAVRQDIRRRGSVPVIPHRKQPNGEYPPSAQGFDKVTYRRRNVIERLIGRLKEYRRIATRYDKLAESFRCFILLGFIRMWLKDLLSYRA